MKLVFSSQSRRAFLAPYSRITTLMLFTLFAAGCASTNNGRSVTETPERPVNIVTEQSGNAEPASQPVAAADPYAAVEVGRFDGGKMWTFDHPPLDYFAETYQLHPDSSWFARARLGALRFSTYCSASFVSPAGLIMTNHHCARESVTEVTRAGESLLDNGFYAASTDEERKVEDLYVEQLVGILDVTNEVYNAVLETPGGEPPVETRRRRSETIERRMQVAAAASDSSLHVQVLALYEGGKYAAYTFKRFEDIRLVFAPELQIGFFGGDYDNFTFPRYNLDTSFFRAYDRDGIPLSTPEHFAWSSDGASDGEAVFVVGNPGSTSRMSTVSQLNYFRDYSLPQSTRVLRDRAEILAAFITENPERSDSFDVRNDYFSLQNSLKAEQGQLEGLRQGDLIARRGAAERRLKAELTQSDSLSAVYGSVLGDIERIQTSKQASSRSAAAFTHFLNPSASSHILARALYGYVYELLKQRGAPPDQLSGIRKEALEIKDWPRELERSFIEHRLTEFNEYLGRNDPTIRRLLDAGTPEVIADSIATYSALADSVRFRQLLDDNYLASGDITVQIITAIAPLYFTLDQQLRDLVDREETFAARLARARFALYGETVPPDASFSLRIADGVVSGYAYNGTFSPAFTTFYGLYDMSYSHTGKKDWELPERWKTPDADFDYSTPLNLVSTNDITGGNSGSPLLNARLEIVGLVFDGNIESLPNDFLYTDVGARTVSVDSRGILAALGSVYDADRLVLELKTGQIYLTEQAADTAASSR